MNGEAPRPVPKPLPRERKAKGWKKKPARDAGSARQDPGRLEFCRSRPCVGLALDPAHICSGDVQASHDRNPMGGPPTGMGRREDARKTCPKCAALHRDWELRRGPFEGWDHERRFYWMRDRIAEVNVDWDALPETQRDWWRGQAEIARRRRAESLRGM